MSLNPADALYRDVVPGGEAWIREVRRGQVLRLVDVKGDQTIEGLFYSAQDYSDRYSAQDTIQSQRNIYLTTASRLISTANHVLLTIVADTCGSHNALGGACAEESNMVMYSLEKRHVHTCRQNFVKAAMDWGHGLTKRDIGSNVSFFRKASVAEDGALSLTEGGCEPGSYVELRAEMDVLAILSNCPRASGSGHQEIATAIEVLIWGSM